jgi:ATP-binding cassette subfamily F protein 3
VAPPPPQARASKTPTGTARRRAEAAEAALARAAQALEAIDAALLDPKTFADPQKAADLSHQRAEAHAALTAAEETWMEAAEALEAVQKANG